MFFIVLAKMKGELTPEFRKATQKTLKSPHPELKIQNVFWTLGQYDFVIIYEAPNEKEALKMGTAWGRFCHCQTMVAIPSKEAQKLFK